MRTIKTKYYAPRNYVEPLRVNSGTDANRAVATCILHMQINQYGAAVAEVYDEDSGMLHAQIKRHADGNITIMYKRDPRKFETRLAIGALFDKPKRK